MQGSIVSAIGRGINAIISAIAAVIETIVSAIVSVLRQQEAKPRHHNRIDWEARLRPQEGSGCHLLSPHAPERGDAL
ncbi:hypothetical protein TRAPUB_12864 [Trametes pubescens]|uniref:Uncharacterized protein n=1 Tax=Trametes pubescens TaxID=154538 RepID=A0A1M2VSR8_TRAPU|nr:hypothetical protein TRAPUB_12864 [Trametes pubescens]